MTSSCWDILGIAPSQDAGEIRRAYARALKSRRPDEDAESFQRLVEARARALDWRWPEPEPGGTPAEGDEGVFADGGIEITLTPEQLSALLDADDTEAAAGQSVRDELEVLRSRFEGGQFVFRPDSEPPPFETAPSPDFVVDRAPALRRALGTLAGLLHGGGAGVAWDGAAWRALMQEVAELDIAQRHVVRDATVRGLLPALPPLPEYERARAEYFADRGPAAVVDVVEQEFALAQDQAKLAATIGSANVLSYLGWVGYARRDVPPARRTPGQARALTMLEELTAADAAPGQHPPEAWNVARWRDFLAILAGLLPGEREPCLGALMHHLAATLPPAFDETAPVFSSRNSVAAVVEAIETACQFDGAGRTLLPVGAVVPPVYDEWRLVAIRLRAVAQRLEQGDYRDENGMPALPQADRGIWASPRFEAYWDQARSLGRWPLRFDWQAFAFPFCEFKALGVRPVLAYVIQTVCLLVVVFAAGDLSSPPAQHWGASAIVLGFLVARAPFAVLMRPLAIRLAMWRIKRADQAGLSAPDTRARHIRARDRGRSFYSRVVEVAVVLMALSTAHEAARPVDPGRMAFENGVSLEASGEHAEAAAAFGRALQIDPANKEAAVQRALSVVQVGDNGKSEAALTEAIALDPGNLLLFADRAWVRYRQGRLADAIADYDQAAAIGPDEAAVLNNRGAVYEQAGDCTKAVADYTHALEHSPGFLPALRNRAHCFERMGAYAKAIVDDTAALDAGKDGTDDLHAQLYTDRGWHHVENSDDALAIEDLQQALRLAPLMQRARMSLGFAEFDTGQFGAAAATLEVSLQPIPSPYGLLFWHLARARAGNADLQALASRRTVLPGQDWPRTVIDMFLGSETPEAVLAAAQTDQQRCEAAFYIGELDILQHRRDAAAEQLARSLSICPTFYIEHQAAKAELHGLRAGWP